MSKYRHIYQEVKSRIVQGIYLKTDKLPEGRKLADEFNCSILTVNKALDLLVKEGLIVRKAGLGSFIKARGDLKQTSSSHSHLIGATTQHAQKGEQITTKVLHYQVLPANKSMADKLDCKEESLIYDLTRLRIVNDKPSIIEYTNMPVSIIPDLTLTHAEKSIYAHIQDTLKLCIHSAKVNITTILPNELEQTHLNIPSHERLICVEQLAYLDNGVLFEHSISKHLAADFKFETNFVKA